jgi:hypothetical protein
MTIPMTAAFRGAAWGLLATVPMSIAMLLGQRLGWIEEQPPEALTEEALARAHALEGMSETTVDGLAVASHLGFGAAAGALFGLVHARAPRVPAIPLGVAWGLGIWAASYRGWIPALGMLPRDQRRGRPGTSVMVAAHVVYGIALGAMAIRRRRRGVRYEPAAPSA